MKLRDYQQKAHDDLIAWFGRNKSGHPIVSAATGAGKSHLIAYLVEQAITSWPNQRVIMLTHSKELVVQNAEKLLALWPDAPIGILSAGLGSKEFDRPIVFGTIGTAANYADDIGYSTLGIVDEAHRVNNRAEGQYRQFIERMQAYNANFRVVGYTATPFRGNGCWLHSGPNTLFSDIAANVGMRELLDQGYLSNLSNVPTEALIDTSGVKKTGADYNLKQLEAVSDDAAITRAAVSEILAASTEHGRDHIVVFCVSIAHAEHVVDEFHRQGAASCELLTGKTDKGTRADILQRFKAGSLRVLVNIGVVTTGFDAPNIDLIALLRPTQSPVLLVQMAGRGARLCDGKQDCLFMDFTDSIERLGPIDLIKGRPYRKPQEDAEAPFCLCPECGAKNPPTADKCLTCGAEIPHEVKAIHDDKVSDAPVLSSNGGRLEAIDRVTYSRHKKSGSPDSVKVTYWNGLSPVADEWICPEHPAGFAKNKAIGWLTRRGLYLAAPTVQDVIDAKDTLITPAAITIRKRGRYTDITGSIFK